MLIYRLMYHDDRLTPCFTQVASPQSNDMWRGLRQKAQRNHIRIAAQIYDRAALMITTKDRGP